ncbi:AEC family transporter [Desulfohalobiaceae bacterium Ax17]|uniref:AEC family transporter n=1 Tax=Desulfovulcanus ferrireducens TaxID=2831190 RepID=UPI00207BBE6F|nr:AEC family transporter [Desulfovulcanus ferrireducens]MBT8763568.1 AEC family transporter [Desulfovulcanus ferrireducens]
MDNFIIIIAYLLIGILLRRISRFPDETGNVLNLFVIYVSLPALVLLKIPELTFSKELLVPTLMPWAMLLLSAFVVIILSKILKWDREVTGALLLLVPLGNTSFLGIPMVKAFFGDQAVSYAVLYDQLGSFLALATYGSLILALYGQRKSTPSIYDVAKKIITFPPFIALALAFLLKSFSYPIIINSLLQTLAATLVPVVMIAVGFQFTLRLRKQVVSPLCIGLAIKLVAAPLAALFISKLFGFSGPAAKVSIFEAGMPPMVSAGALAILAGLSPALTAALVGLGIILSFATLPLLYQFL